MKEMAVHRWFKARIKSTYGPNVVYFKPPAGMHSSRRGISDFICCIYGMYVAIEVKREAGMTPTPIQQNFLDEVNNAGGLGLCLAGKDETIFDAIEDMLAVRRPGLQRD